MWQTTTKENLPLPYVQYPYAWLGAFPGFCEVAGGSVFFCECQRSAIFNRLVLGLPGICGTPMMRTGFRLPDTEDFPVGFFQPILATHPTSNDAFNDALQFRVGICHQCNRRVPPASVLLPPSTDAFSTLFRSYRRKLAFEHGVDLADGLILTDRCSSAIREIVPFHPLLYRQSSDSCDEYWRDISERHRLWRHYLRPVSEFLGAQLRISLGFPIRGPRLTSETILFLRTVSALPEYQVARHHRPRGFRGLSLDIFIPELAIAIEYQGVQHQKPIEHWGGEAGLARTRNRDARKAGLCKQAGISLIYSHGNVTFISEDDIRTTVLNRAKRPNDAMQLTGSGFHSGCFKPPPPYHPPAAVVPRSTGS